MVLRRDVRTTPSTNGGGASCRPIRKAPWTFPEVSGGPETRPCAREGAGCRRSPRLELSRFHGRLVSVVNRIRCPFSWSLSSRWREAVCVRPDARDEAGGGPGAAGSRQARTVVLLVVGRRLVAEGRVDPARVVEALDEPEDLPARLGPRCGGGAAR